MSGAADDRSRLSGFYKLDIPARRSLLSDRFGLNDSDLDAFDCASGLKVQTADDMVENALGVLALPLGLAVNFVVNGEAVCVPMAVEEPSVIAACSYIARLAHETGGFKAETDPSEMVAQVQILDADEDAISAIESAASELVEQANTYCPGLVSRGGGVRHIEVRELPRYQDDDVRMVVAHLVVDCVDAMGANALNTIAEKLAPTFEELSGGRVSLRILSNLADRRCARASVRINYDALGGRAVAADIYQAYRFADRDAYRACTHNKGVMNGIDALVIATGNDWRAIESGAHAYAAHTGRYRSLTHYSLDDDAKQLVGNIELPMALGTVGGATRVHPGVMAARKVLGTFSESSRKLAGLCAAVGLAQNLAALRALCAEGIQSGHMRMHARQLALAAGAEGPEVKAVAQALVATGDIRMANAEVALQSARAGTL